MRVISTRILYK